MCVCVCVCMCMFVHVVCRCSVRCHWLIWFILFIMYIMYFALVWFASCWWCQYIIPNTVVSVNNATKRVFIFVFCFRYLTFIHWSHPQATLCNAGFVCDFVIGGKIDSITLGVISSMHIFRSQVPTAWDHLFYISFWFDTLFCNSITLFSLLNPCLNCARVWKLCLKSVQFSFASLAYDLAICLNFPYHLHALTTII